MQALYWNIDIYRLNVVSISDQRINNTISKAFESTNAMFLPADIFRVQKENFKGTWVIANLAIQGAPVWTIEAECLVWDCYIAGGRLKEKFISELYLERFNGDLMLTFFAIVFTMSLFCIITNPMPLLYWS